MRIGLGGLKLSSSTFPLDLTGFFPEKHLLQFLMI